jgi:inner membrane protein YhjD
VQRLLDRIDAFQQRHRFPGFIFAVLKKFGDDSAGSLSALITYYAFLSLFPLLLVLVTVLGYVLHGNQDLQRRIIDSALGDFPVIGQQLRDNISSVKGNGIGLVVGILVTFYGGLGVANVTQDAMNRVWAVPIRVRPGFFPKLLRSLEIIGLLVVAIGGTTTLTIVASSMTAEIARISILIGSFVMNVVLFTLAFIITTTKSLRIRDVLPGAIISAIAWVVLHLIGEAIVNHAIKGMSASYGAFAVVLGLLAWIFLQARIMLYAAEVNVVRATKLWPRALAPPPLTEADRRAFELYALAQERRPEARLSVALHDDEPVR